MNDFEKIVQPRSIFVLKSKNGKYFDFYGNGSWTQYFHCSKFHTECDLLDGWNRLSAHLKVFKKHKKLEKLNQSLLSAKIVKIEFAPYVSERPFLFNLDSL